MGLQFALSFFISFFFLPSHSPRGVGGGAKGRLAEVTLRAAERLRVESRDAFVCGLFAVDPYQGKPWVEQRLWAPGF